MRIFILSVLVAMYSFSGNAAVLIDGNVTISGVVGDSGGQNDPPKALTLSLNDGQASLTFNGHKYRPYYIEGFKQWRGEFSEEVIIDGKKYKKHVLLSIITEKKHFHSIATAPSKYNLPQGPLSYFADFYVQFFNPWSEIKCDIGSGDNAFIMYKETIEDRPDGLSTHYYGNCAALNLNIDTVVQ